MNGPEILCEISRVLTSEAYAVGMEPTRHPGVNLCQGSLDVGYEALSRVECAQYATSLKAQMVLHAILLQHGIDNVEHLKLVCFKPEGAYFTFSSYVGD